MSDESDQRRLWNAPIVMAAGAILGAVLVLVAIGVVFWSEGKTINTAVSLEQGAADARTVPAERVLPMQWQRLRKKIQNERGGQIQHECVVRGCNVGYRITPTGESAATRSCGVR